MDPTKKSYGGCVSIGFSCRDSVGHGDFFSKVMFLFGVISPWGILLETQICQPLKNCFPCLKNSKKKKVP